MRRTILRSALSVVFAVTLLAAGCQEKNASSQERKSKLETLEMKNEIKAKDKEIKKQENLLADCKKENEKIQETNGDAMKKLMEILAKSEVNAAVLQAENSKLKLQLKNAGL